MAVVFFEPVGVLLFMIFAFVPSNFAIIGNTQNPAMGQWDGDYKVFLEHRDDLVFVLLRIHEGQGVMVVHHDADITLAPDVEHCLVDDFGEGGLGIVGNSFAKCGWIGTTPEEPALAVHERDKIALLAEGFVDVGLPALVGWEGREVFGLELANEVEFYFRLFCECIWLSSLIRTMTKLFTHESIGIVSVVRSFGDSLIRFKIASPRKIWPHNTSNSSMRVP